MDEAQALRWMRQVAARRFGYDRLTVAQERAIGHVLAGRDTLAVLPTGGEVHRAIQGEGFDAARYDAERAERYRRRDGFY